MLRAAGGMHPNPVQQPCPPGWKIAVAGRANYKWGALGTDL